MQVYALQEEWWMVRICTLVYIFLCSMYTYTCVGTYIVGECTYVHSFLSYIRTCRNAAMLDIMSREDTNTKCNIEGKACCETAPGSNVLDLRIECSMAWLYVQCVYIHVHIHVHIRTCTYA